MIDRKRLKAIVEAEIRKMMKEVNAAHKSDGTFAKKGKGVVYSLTKNAEDDVAEDSELEVPARGRITSQGKIAAKYGMSTGDEEKQCGKLNISGAKKKKTRSCKDYPKNYWSEGDELADSHPNGELLKGDDEEDEEVEIEVEGEDATLLKRRKKKRDTEQRNKNKNLNDLIPRSNDSPSVRRDKLFGDDELRKLSIGIAEELADEEDEAFPRWDKAGKLVSGKPEPDDDVEDLEEKSMEPHDEIYVKELIKKNIATALKNTKQQATQQRGRGCSWDEIMKALRDVELAQNPPKPKS
jgi:hypothetical protein